MANFACRAVTIFIELEAGRRNLECESKALTLITVNQALKQQEFEGRKRRVRLLGAPWLDRVDACTLAGAIGWQRGHWHVVDARRRGGLDNAGCG
eukprot:scaffold6241_cov64-Phaeocystis_antarctica.AAC.9